MSPLPACLPKVILSLTIYCVFACKGLYAQAAWGTADGYATSPVVKVHVPELEENGTGLLIGEEGGQVYLITAAHVVSSPDDEDEPLDADILVNVKVQEYDLEGVNKGAEGLIAARIAYFDPKLDLAVLRIDWSALPASQTGKPMQPVLSPMGFLTMAACTKGEMARLDGFSGGSQGSYDKIELMIQGLEYYGDARAFRMEAVNIEGGHSGAPVFNSTGEWLGLMLKRNGTGTACKVLKAATILAQLSEAKLPVNWLTKPMLTGSWTVIGIVEKGDNPTLISFPPTEPALVIDAHGKLSGLTSGSLCISNARLSFNQLPNGAHMMLPIYEGTSSHNLHRAVFEEGRSYALRQQMNPLQPTQLSQLKLICDQYEVWLYPAY